MSKAGWVNVARFLANFLNQLNVTSPFVCEMLWCGIFSAAVIRLQSNAKAVMLAGTEGTVWNSLTTLLMFSAWSKWVYGALLEFLGGFFCIQCSNLLPLIQTQQANRLSHCVPGGCWALKRSRGWIEWQQKKLKIRWMMQLAVLGEHKGYLSPSFYRSHILPLISVCVCSLTENRMPIGSAENRSCVMGILHRSTPAHTPQTSHDRQTPTLTNTLECLCGIQ